MLCAHSMGSNNRCLCIDLVVRRPSDLPPDWVGINPDDGQTANRVLINPDSFNTVPTPVTLELPGVVNWKNSPMYWEKVDTFRLRMTVLEKSAYHKYIHCRYANGFGGPGMRTQLSKWGHSLAVRIPRAFVDQLGLSEGSSIEIIASGDAITLRKPRYTLEGLLADVTTENLHDEHDMGRAVGREEW